MVNCLQCNDFNTKIFVIENIIITLIFVYQNDTAIVIDHKWLKINKVIRSLYIFVIWKS